MTEKISLRPSIRVLASASQICWRVRILFNKISKMDSLYIWIRFPNMQFNHTGKNRGPHNRTQQNTDRIQTTLIVWIFVSMLITCSDSRSPIIYFIEPQNSRRQNKLSINLRNIDFWNFWEGCYIMFLNTKYENEAFSVTITVVVPWEQTWTWAKRRDTNEKYPTCNDTTIWRPSSTNCQHFSAVILSSVNLLTWSSISNSIVIL
jgi:hypothetical protein